MEGKLRWVIEPSRVGRGLRECIEDIAPVRTFMVHQPTDLLLSPQVPNLDNLICAPRCEPFASLRRRGDGLDTRHMGGEDEYRLEVVLEFSGLVHGRPAVQSVEQFFVRSCDDFEGGWEFEGGFLRLICTA